MNTIVFEDRCKRTVTIDSTERFALEAEKKTRCQSSKTNNYIKRPFNEADMKLTVEQET